MSLQNLLMDPHMGTGKGRLREIRTLSKAIHSMVESGSEPGPSGRADSIILTSRYSSGFSCISEIRDSYQRGTTRVRGAKALMSAEVNKMLILLHRLN